MKKLGFCSAILFVTLGLCSTTAYSEWPVRAQLVESIPLVGIDKVHQRYGLTGAGVHIYIIDHFSESNPKDHGWFVKAIIEKIAPAAQISICDMHYHDAFQGSSSCMGKLMNDPAKSRQVNLINASFVSGTYSTQQSSECELSDVLGLDQAEAMSEYLDEKLLVAAVGNNDSGKSLLFPACLPQVLSVGATYDSGEQIDDVAPFSNRPPFMDVVAPGAPKVTPWPESHFSGTSAATPIVTGIAALLLEADRSLSPARMRNLLIATGDSAYDPARKFYHPRVNAIKAVQQILGRAVVPSPNSEPDIEVVSAQLVRDEVIQGEELCVEVQLFNHGGEGSFEIEVLQGGIEKLSTSRPVGALQEVSYEVCYNVFLVGQHKIEIRSHPLNFEVGRITVVRDMPKLPPLTRPPSGNISGLHIFDDNNNALIDDSEFFGVVDLWIAQEVSDELFFRMIDAWIGRVRLQETWETDRMSSFQLLGQGGKVMASGECSNQPRKLALSMSRYQRLPVGVYVLIERDCETAAQRVSFLANVR